MEKALQDCCRSMRIGKILVDSDSDTHEAHVVFAKFPDDIANRKVRHFSREKILQSKLRYYFRKSTKFQIFESQENVWPIFDMKQLERDETKDTAELALRSRFL